jgi:hypothetical protein
VLEDDTRLLGTRGERAAATLEPTAALPASTSVMHRLLPAFGTLAERLVAHIHGDATADHPTFRDGLRVQAAMEAAHRSAASGRFEPVPA